MQSQTVQETVTTLPAMSYGQMLEQVRYNGAYPTRERAEQVVSAVLAAFGRRVTGEERVELAARLPREAARVFAAEIPATDELTGWAFVRDLAARTGGTLATTRWDVGSVLGVVARIAGPDLLDRVLAQLPSGYAILFGRAELTQAA
ncbi:MULTISPECIES: DUF2267 domain-containing protein [Streptomyces]|uniref:DUF2267 domain-containing protein n=3 Tax=Streptomyces rochei group TaxID=2867164 RepID=A0AAX3ZBN4_STRRO|nr:MULTISPECIES: DUF2267 domain-containing protein [Streptomyces]WDI16592.1 DUF2267 domain-containing protein [Streptomyces enissocaesilis]MDI3099021.1 DUF2267 domain-containing protein [Streptomyces sp. AN-3]UXI77037.1 DUF2267 domain-containing protein [Streptomyces vinaceusdrappus]WMC84591.1 DUF2267 domain-containing protein [Streptomyces rochei]WMI60976.1 DUF2267 domain-containing protein [Streptomyces rochei]